MSMPSEREAAILQAMRPQLEAEGFSVFVQPSQDLLPPFMAGLSPDAIALKPDHKLAIEVVSDTGQAGSRVQRLRDIVAAHADWELRVIYAPVSATAEEIPASGRAEIEAWLHRIEHGYDVIGPAVVLLTAWAALEAAARLCAPAAFAQPRGAARLLEWLAGSGYVTPSEADLLRRLGRMRNQIAHGHMGMAPDRRDLAQFLAIIRTILQLADSAPAA